MISGVTVSRRPPFPAFPPDVKDASIGFGVAVDFVIR
jgi:hypothetical protein